MISTVWRILLTVLAAAVGVGLFVYSDYSLKKYFGNNLRIQNELQNLRTNLYALEGEILQNGSFLYYSYDNINHLVHRTDRLLRSLETDPSLQSDIHRKSRQKIRQLTQRFTRYIDQMQRYLTLNASLKNSIIYIPTLQLKAYSIFNAAMPEDRETLLLLSKINATIFLARNSQDTDFLADIRNYLQELDKRLEIYDGVRGRLLRTLKSHLVQFSVDFPLYVRQLDYLIHNDLIDRALELDQTFQKEAGNELKLVNHTSRIILLLYLFSLLATIYFILKAQRENRRLREVKKTLEATLVTDTLTGLANRTAYRRIKATMKAPVLILVNIDRFKHINEFYGTRTGDKTLIAVSKKLQEITPAYLDAAFFRMGGDDFGILFEQESAKTDPHSILEYFHEKLEDYRLPIDGITIDLSFALGGSDRKEWLFETADMALKSAKSSQRKRYAFYTPDMDKREAIAQNIQALRNIRAALSNDTLLPHFQPICDLKNHRISKFEALARIELDDGNNILQPASFIHAATEAKMSGKITLKILEKTLAVAERHPYSFSINLSAADIADREDREQIIALLSTHRHLAERIVFEILETEEVRNYESVANFIDSVKSFGCRIAIDDFGSGYSNFEKILKLNVDILKVDGSLIRRIDHDHYSEMTVRAILDFARHAGWQTVAEFVHSESVYSKVAAMGFDYVQGYYLGKPSKQLQEEMLLGDAPELL